MAIGDVADQYFTYEARIASFQNAHQLAKRRASNAITKAGKSLKWPHKFLTGDEVRILQMSISANHSDARLACQSRFLLPSSTIQSR